MEDFRSDGFNAGYGCPDRNHGHEDPQTDADRYSYNEGFQEGLRRRQLAEELAKELWGEG